MAQDGTPLRVLAAQTEADDADRLAQRLNEALARAGQQGKVIEADPNLEDVFVAATRDGNGRAEARAA